MAKKKTVRTKKAATAKKKRASATKKAAASKKKIAKSTKKQVVKPTKRKATKATKATKKKTAKAASKPTAAPKKKSAAVTKKKAAKKTVARKAAAKKVTKRSSAKDKPPASGARTPQGSASRSSASPGSAPPQAAGSAPNVGAPGQASVTQTPGLSTAGTDSLARLFTGLQSIWQDGTVQQAARAVVQGKTGVRQAVADVTEPAHQLLTEVTQDFEAQARVEQQAEEQLAKDLAIGRAKDVKPQKNQGKDHRYRTALEGLVTDADGQPAPGLVVQANRSTTKRRELLALALTDENGRYRLGLHSDNIADLKQIRIDVALGLQRDASLFRSDAAKTVKVGTTATLDIKLDESATQRASGALKHGARFDRARLAAAQRRMSGQTAERMALVKLNSGLSQLLDKLGTP